MNFIAGSPKKKSLFFIKTSLLGVILHGESRAFPSLENACQTLIQGRGWGIEAKIKKII